MQAVLFESAGPLEDVLVMKHADQEVPRPGEVLVRVDARPIQPADFMFVEGRYRIRPAYPQIAGLEGAGTVVASGEGVTLTLGTRVAFRHPGTWAEFVAVPLDRCYVVPAEVSIESAAQFALNPVTGWALLDELHVQPGDWIAINAATSAVAQIAQSLAQRRNVGVVGIVRPGSAVEVSFPTVSADTADLASKVLAITGGTLLAGYLDSVGGMLIKNILSGLRQGATIVSYGVLEQTPAPMLNSDLIYRNLSWKGFGIDHWLATAKERHDTMAAELWSAIRDGELPLPVRARYPLKDFRSAVIDAAMSGRSGKVLIAD